MLKNILIVAFCCFPFTALSGEPDIPDIAQVVSIHMIPGWRMENGHRIAAVQVTMAPGWKTYWRASGETGLPPKFDWSGSENVAAVTYHWPRPEIIDDLGVSVIGYKNELVLPLEFTALNPEKPLVATAKLAIGVCKDVCIPVTQSISVTLGADADTHDFLIELALADQPESATVAGLRAARCRVEKTSDGYRVTGRFDLWAKSTSTETVIFETRRSDIWVSGGETRREDAILIASADMVSIDGKPFKPDLSALRITVIGKNRAVEINGCKN